MTQALYHNSFGGNALRTDAVIQIMITGEESSLFRESGKGIAWFQSAAYSEIFSGYVQERHRLWFHLC